MTTFEEIIKRATALGIPIAKNEFRKTAKKPVPDPPYLIYLLNEEQRGDDKRNRIREINGSIELYTDRVPDETLEQQIENEVLFDIEFSKEQALISSENMIQTAYDFKTIQKGR
ncbi:hypothetical protein ACEG19_04030 [Blautia stercoris]|uniref:hypothetical protein n=1 Tax=Blautia stercoris TaxID=871664 RepID=UPI00355C8DDF